MHVNIDRDATIELWRNIITDAIGILVVTMKSFAPYMTERVQKVLTDQHAILMAMDVRSVPEDGFPNAWLTVTTARKTMKEALRANDALNLNLLRDPNISQEKLESVRASLRDLANMLSVHCDSWEAEVLSNSSPAVRALIQGDTDPVLQAQLCERLARVIRDECARVAK